MSFFQRTIYRGDITKTISEVHKDQGSMVLKEGFLKILNEYSMVFLYVYLEKVKFAFQNSFDV